MISQKGYLLSDFCELFHNVLLALQISKFFVELQIHKSQTYVISHLQKKARTMAIMSIPMSGIYLFSVAINLE